MFVLSAINAQKYIVYGQGPIACTLRLRYDLHRKIKNINKDHKFNATIKNFLFDKMQKSDQSYFVYY